MTSLEVRELDAGYGSLQVIWGVSLVVGRGEVAVILGPNGAGKSTLLAAIAGDIRSIGGRVLVDGVDVSHYGAANRLRSGLAWVPEGRNVFLHLSVRDNLRMSAKMAGTLAQMSESEALIFDLFPAMFEKRESIAGTLSGGQQQILAISRALARRPNICLLDEPTVGLSPEIVSRLQGAIAATKREGVSWMVSEQSVGWLVGITDSTYVLQGGRIVASGGPEVLASREAVWGAFFEQAREGGK